MVSSCLTGAKRGMKRAVLEVIATKAVVYAADVKRYIKCTLLAATTNFEVHFPVSIMGAVQDVISCAVKPPSRTIMPMILTRLPEGLPSLLFREAIP